MCTAFATRSRAPVAGPGAVQRRAKASIPLRHTGLTRLARLGATPYTVQSMARHARLQTTQDHLPMQQVTLSREAADLLDNAAKPRGKRVAVRAKSR